MTDTGDRGGGCAVNKIGAWSWGRIVVAQSPPVKVRFTATCNPLKRRDGLAQASQMRAGCLTMSLRATLSKRELIADELQHLPEPDLDKLLEFMRSLKESHAENAVPTLAAESSLAKDWLTLEEDAAWASL